MAQYLKKKIKDSSSLRKTSKGIIQYAEVDDDQYDQNTDDYEQTHLNNTSDYNNNDHSNNDIAIRIDSQEDYDDGFSKSRTINIPVEYTLNIEQNLNGSNNSNDHLFQSIDINGNEDSNLIHSQNGRNRIRNIDIMNDPNQIIVESDAWPEQQEAQVKSYIHKLLRREMTQIDPSKIYFKQIDKSHLKELKALHEEWFPLNYPESFYNKIHKKKIMAIGCFIDLDEENSNVILGTILVNIKTNNEEIIDMYKAKDITENSYLFGWLRSTISCREYQAAYIMTIGIVDECRRMGLGTLLLNEAIKALQQTNTACEVIYLHVVDYNESAIRFYERNNFRMLRRIKEHYVIFDKNYDALVLYKDIKNYKNNDDNLDVESNREDRQIQNINNGYLSYITYPVTFMYNKVFGNS